jgi:hypothetical protein
MLTLCLLLLRCFYAQDALQALSGAEEEGGGGGASRSLVVVFVVAGLHVLSAGISPSSGARSSGTTTPDTSRICYRVKAGTERPLFAQALISGGWLPCCLADGVPLLPPPPKDRCTSVLL